MYPDTTDEVGMLIGGVMGTVPALVVLAACLWWGSVIVERRSRTNGTPRTQAQHVGVRPKIHEALVDENTADYDGSHVVVWNKTQPLSVTRILNGTSSCLHPVTRKASDTQLVTFWAVRMPHAHTTPALVDLDLGVCITGVVGNSDSQRGDYAMRRNVLRLL